jgi:hypothetical protein
VRAIIYGRFEKSKSRRKEIKLVHPTKNLNRLADSTAQIGYNKKAHLNKMSFQADRTGLEPATSCVTGRHSNQLNYRSVLLLRVVY